MGSNSGTIWTEEEVRAVQNTKLTAEDLSKVIGRSVRAIQEKRWRMGIYVTQIEKRIAPQESMTQEEKEYRIYKLASKYGVKIQ